MQTIKSNEYRPIPWSSIVLAELPSILFILQLSTNAANQAWIILLLIFISGGYLILHSYKKHVFTVSLFLPFIGVLVMETWIFLDWFTNPHSSLLLTRVWLIFLCIPSLVILYTKRSNLKKAVWLILVAFVITAFILYYNATGDWSIFFWNMLQWLICIIPFFAFSVLCLHRFKVPLGLTLMVFEPFWINYILDPLSSTSHVTSIVFGLHAIWGFRLFQIVPILGFLLIMPIINFRSTSKTNAMSEQVLSLLFILPSIIIRFTILDENQAEYLFPIWILILIYLFVLWFPLWLPLFFQKNTKVFEHAL